MSIERKVVYYEQPGKEHTEETLKTALEAVSQREIDTIENFDYLCFLCVGYFCS